MNPLLVYLIEVVPALFVIINPIGAALIFVSMTGDDSDIELKQKSRRVSVAVFLSLIIFMFLGHFIFKMFGITLPAFRIAGGILLFGMGMSMIRGQHPKSKITEKERFEVQSKEDITIIPMAIPVLSGPGAMATVMMYKENAHNITEIMILIGAIFFSSLMTYYIFKSSHKLVQRFGKTAFRIITRIMGMLVTTIAVQFVLSGATNVVLDLWGQLN
jgi:multiple antibiotic resistance protein